MLSRQTPKIFLKIILYNLGMSEKRLTIKQQRFVEAYTTCYDVAEALSTAGYAPHHSTGSKLLSTPHIQIAINSRQAQLREHLDIDREMLVSMLLEDRTHAQRVRDSIQAARQIGLMLGLFADPS